MPLSSLEASQPYTLRWNRDILYQRFPAGLLRHITWTRIEPFLQRSYMGEKYFSLISHNGRFLNMHLSEEIFQKTAVGKPVH